MTAIRSLLRAIVPRTDRAMVKEKLKCRPQKKEIENNKLLLRVVVEWGSWLLPIAMLTPDPSDSLHMLLGGGNLVMCLMVAGLIGETETDCEKRWHTTRSWCCSKAAHDVILPSSTINKSRRFRILTGPCFTSVGRQIQRSCKPNAACSSRAERQ